MKNGSNLLYKEISLTCLFFYRNNIIISAVLVAQKYPLHAYIFIEIIL